MAAFWPFGVAYGVVGTIFGVGLLGLCAALGLPKSIDLMFGLILALIAFGAHFFAEAHVHELKNATPKRRGRRSAFSAEVERTAA